ncbi:MAG: hypothetical protein ACE3JK_10305 [Sporolactobacillus sp.]
MIDLIRTELVLGLLVGGVIFIYLRVLTHRRARFSANIGVALSYYSISLFAVASLFLIMLLYGMATLLGVK